MNMHEPVVLALYYYCPEQGFILLDLLLTWSAGQPLANRNGLA
jgi:hypothetical protein